jgi:osmotically-inducible protein OsmY
MRIRAAVLTVAALAATLWFPPQKAFASGRDEVTTSPPGRDKSPMRDAEARLNKAQFNNVKVDVEDGVATLTGSVDLFEYKKDAENRVRKAKSIKATRNLINVAGKDIADDKLQERLVDRLSYDRVGYGNVFNAISVNVNGGTVTLDGHARTYMDRDSALALVATTPGVLEMVDSIEVDPVSLMDDDIRIRVARAVYGDSALRKYSINPAKPIRISVQDGKVSLYGMVDNEMDANIALIRANGVSGVFAVNNQLQVAGNTSEKLN